MAWAILLAAASTHADIYRYTDEHGVECFTDNPGRKGTRILKERRNPTRAHGAVTKKGRLVPRASDLAGAELTGEREILPGVLPVSGRISSFVGMRQDPIDGLLRDHKGVDIATPEGTPVRPVAPGVVIFSGYRPGYGNTVTIRHTDGTITLYAHNSQNLKSEGEAVDTFSPIAFSGSTGRSTGPHLHFEAWRDGRNITSSFIPGADSTMARPVQQDIRRSITPDGTLVFTNLP